MENREHFGALTDRMQAFREEVLDEKPFVDAERAVLCTQSYRQTKSQPPVMRRALSLAHILDSAPRAGGPCRCPASPCP